MSLAVDEPVECRAGEVLQGLIKPDECECFGTTCTPRSPMGATMVSSEGACAAYFQYRRVAPPVRATAGSAAGSDTGRAGPT